MDIKSHRHKEACVAKGVYKQVIKLKTSSEHSIYCCCIVYHRYESVIGWCYREYLIPKYIPDDKHGYNRDCHKNGGSHKILIISDGF